MTAWKQKFLLENKLESIPESENNKIYCMLFQDFC